jgi:hypothetical protein
MSIMLNVEIAPAPVASWAWVECGALAGFSAERIALKIREISFDFLDEGQDFSRRRKRAGRSSGRSWSARFDFPAGRFFGVLETIAAHHTLHSPAISTRKLTSKAIAH